MIQFSKVFMTPKRVKNPALCFIYAMKHLGALTRMSKLSMYSCGRCSRNITESGWGAKNREDSILPLIPKNGRHKHKEALRKYKRVGKQGRRVQRWEWDLCYFDFWTCDWLYYLFKKSQNCFKQALKWSRLDSDPFFLLTSVLASVHLSLPPSLPSPKTRLSTWDPH